MTLYPVIPTSKSRWRVHTGSCNGKQITWYHQMMFFWMLYIITFLFVYIYISSFSILLQSIQQGISSLLVNTTTASQQYRNASVRNQLQLYRRYWHYLKQATPEYCSFMYFICNVYTIWHYKISNKTKMKAVAPNNVSWLVSIFRTN